MEVAAALRDFPRQALHAWRIAFVHPVTRALIEVESVLPYDFTGLLAATVPSWGLTGV